MLETERLILRRWEDSDAESLYEYAKDPDVGPIAGWPTHQSVEESRDIIRTVLNDDETYAVCLKTDGKAIGAIALKRDEQTELTDRDDECELGYWLGKPFWEQGIITEATKEILRHAFEDLNMAKVWVAYYEGNSRSKGVQEYCGFRYQWKSEDVNVPLMHEKRTGHVSSMTKEQWMRDRVHTAIVYYSKHHGNTKKLLDAIAAEEQVVLIDVTENGDVDLTYFDRIGFASGIYYSSFAKQILSFAEAHLPENKDVFYIYTHGAPKGIFLKKIREIAAGKNCRELGYYHCLGFDTFGPFKLVGGIAKGHPTKEEIAGAVKFYQSLQQIEPEQ